MLFNPFLVGQYKEADHTLLFKQQLPQFDPFPREIYKLL